MDESACRSTAPVGFLRRGSGISLRNQSNEDRSNQYNKQPGKSSNPNPVKLRFTENKEKPRYFQGTFHSSGSRASSVSSSKAPARKYCDERQKQPFLAETDIAESSNRRTEVRRLQSGKKASVFGDGHPYTQKSISEASSSSTITGGLPEEHDLGALYVSGSSGSSAHPVNPRNAALNASAHMQKDKEEMSSGRPQGAPTFVRRHTLPQSFSTGVKSPTAPGTGAQRRGLKNLGCTSISDVLPSGCSSSDSARDRRIEVTKKRTSGAGSSSRSRISEQSNFSQPRASYPGSTGPRARAAEQSASQQTARTNSRNIPDHTDSIRTRRPFTLRARERMMPGEREDSVFALHETVASIHPECGHFHMDGTPPERLGRPFYAELPHAIYSSNRQGSSSQTARRRSTSRTEGSPQRMFHGMFWERDGYRGINMEGIAQALLALDRIEHDVELTYEQLLLLETNLLLSGLDLHDQHEDMRLDIDNMSYEELLALEEHIGSVTTALTEEQFTKCVNQSVYEARNSYRDVSKIAADDVKCSVCQEEYVDGEEIGTMQCEHQYHVRCIHEWLKQKNWCPICKASAIPSEMTKGDA